MQLPDYNFLSAPLWLVTVLHIVTLTLHFLAMNFVVGGLIAILWGKFTDRWNNPVVKWSTIGKSIAHRLSVVGSGCLSFRW